MQTNSSNFPINRNDLGTVQSRHHALLRSVSNLPARSRLKRSHLTAERTASSAATAPILRRLHRPIASKPHDVQLPGRIVSDGGWEARRARPPLVSGHAAEIYGRWTGNRQALANWTADDFESDFDRICDSEVGFSDFPGLRRELLAQRHFD